MRIVLLAFAFVLVIAACGGSSPTSDCNSIASTYCNKYFQCSQSAADQQYGNESACETKIQQSFGCATWACPTGETYNGSEVDSCISAYNSLSCGDISMTPSQCQNLAPACN